MAKKESNTSLNHLHVGVLAVSSILLAIVSMVQILDNANAKEGKGFDELGYNRSARIFNGVSDGVDGVLDGKTYGDPTYGNDRLNMKWNAEWDRGNAEGWTDDYYNAWIDNQWNGQVPGGSGEIWHYRIKWVGADLQNSEYWVAGGYPIWGQFEVIMSQGTVANEHFWDAHAKPAGFRVF